MLLLLLMMMMMMTMTTTTMMMMVVVMVMVVVKFSFITNLMTYRILERMVRQLNSSIGNASAM